MLLAALALVAATPASLPAVLGAAKGGDRIRLAPGSYGEVTVTGKTYAPPIVIDAGAGATLTALNILGSGGVGLTGGKVAGGNERGYAILIRQSQNVKIDKVLITEAKRGIVVDRSQDIALTGNTLKELTIDGVNVAQSQRVLIEGNDCTSYSTGKAHPDCYQAWSRPGGITTDLIIRNNRATGNVQGIFLGNHVRKGVDDGGFDRVTITGNTVRNLYPQGINAGSVRGLVLKDNDVASLPGARFKTAINTRRSEGIVCNNRVIDVPGSPAAERCR